MQRWTDFTDVLMVWAHSISLPMLTLDLNLLDGSGELLGGLDGCGHSRLLRGLLSGGGLLSGSGLLNGGLLGGGSLLGGLGALLRSSLLGGSLLSRGLFSSSLFNSSLLGGRLLSSNLGNSLNSLRLRGNNLLWSTAPKPPLTSTTGAATCSTSDLPSAQPHLHPTFLDMDKGGELKSEVSVLDWEKHASHHASLCFLASSHRHRAPCGWGRRARGWCSGDICPIVALVRDPRSQSTRTSSIPIANCA